MSITAYVELFGAILAAVIALGLIGFGVYGVFHGQSIQTNVAVLSAGNTEMRGQLAEMADKAAREQAECREMLHQQELACHTQIADLQGQLKTLTGDFVRQLIEAVAAAVKVTTEGTAAVAAHQVLDTATAAAVVLATSKEVK